MATITKLKIEQQSGTDRSFYATWDSALDHVDHYEIKWYYATGDGQAFDGSSENTTRHLTGLYSPPNNAYKVGVEVKPVSKTRKVNGKETSYWTGSWVYKDFSLGFKIPTIPPVPTVTFNGLSMKVEVEGYIDDSANIIEFEVRENLNYFGKYKAYIRNNDYAGTNIKVRPGVHYKVRARAINLIESGQIVSDWSEYTTSNSTIPAVPVGLHLKYYKDKTTNQPFIHVEWKHSTNAKKYNVQYTFANKGDFSMTNPSPESVDSDTYKINIGGIEPGKRYYFRVKAINDSGESEYNKDIKSIKIGLKPDPPITWANKKIALQTDPITIYWTHSSVDKSLQERANIYLKYIHDDGTITTSKAEVNSSGQSIDTPINYIYSYDIGHINAKELSWQISTKGVSDEYSNLSEAQTIKIYNPPSLGLDIIDLDPLTSELIKYPLKISYKVGPPEQNIISLILEIVSEKDYYTVDISGNEVLVSKGQVIYSKNIVNENINFPKDGIYDISATDVCLMNGISYTLRASLTMSSGFTAVSNKLFYCNISDINEYLCDAQLYYDKDNLRMHIVPECKNLNDELVSNINMTVLKRDYDNRLHVIAKDLKNDGTTVVDMHPSLDYARYRIVATDLNTGTVSFNDLPGYPINEKSLIIQWNENWSSYNYDNEEGVPSNSSVFGNIIKLPYNLDINESVDKDVVNAKYAGRQNPVAYYGTMKEESMSISTEIPSHDKDSLYKLRQLSTWMNDVYVREPNGNGYYATISIKMSHAHNKVTIPVSIEVKKIDKEDGESKINLGALNSIYDFIYGFNDFMDNIF